MTEEPAFPVLPVEPCCATFCAVYAVVGAVHNVYIICSAKYMFFGGFGEVV